MINRAILIGRLGSNPEMRQTKTGIAVASFSVATSETWKDTDGQKQEQTEWHRLVAFGRLAEICDRYLKKGAKVYIEGKLQTRRWEDQSGQPRSTTEILVREMKMLDSRQGIQDALEPSDQGQYPIPGSSEGNISWDDFKMGDDVPF